MRESRLRIKIEHKKGIAEKMWAPVKLKLHPEYMYIYNNIFLQILYYFGVLVWLPVAYLIFKILFGFKVINRSNTKLIKDTAAITIANHVHNMDSPLSAVAFYPSSPYYIAHPHNFEAFIIGVVARIMRGVPLPSDLSNFRNFSKQINAALQTTKKKIHFYPEGELVPYGRELRPFRKGAFHFAVKNDVPVLPMTFVFSPKNHVRLIIGKPIYVRDVPDAEGQKNVIKTSMLCDYVKNEMQKMMDEYYKENPENL